MGYGQIHEDNIKELFTYNEWVNVEEIINLIDLECFAEYIASDADITEEFIILLGQKLKEVRE